jgi:peptide/nickel transport system substrate-binding protein
MHIRSTLLVVTVAALSVAAAVSSAATDRSSVSAAEPGTLTIATIEDVRSPDSILEGGTTTDKLMMGSTVYEPLFTTGRKTELKPALALKATSNKKFTTWTVKLRRNVHFSNGKLFTAADVKENFDAFKNPKNASGFAGDLENLASTKVVDTYTVQFRLKHPDAHFPQATEDTMYISDLDARKTGQLLSPGEVPIGTGPYEWSARSPGTSVTFVRNPDYWRGRPPLSKVVFRVIPDGQNAVIALQKGEVDMIANYVPPQALPQLRKDPNIRIVSSAGSTEYHAWMNFKKKYANARDVHLGLNYLMNSKNIVPKLIGDFGQLATQPIPPWQLGHDPTIKPYPYNPQKGKQLLAKGGIQEGDTIKLVAIQDRPFLCDWATAVQSNLKSLGYDAQLDCRPSAAMTPVVQKYDWDLLFWRNSGRALSHITYLQRWGVAVASPPTDTYTLRDQKLQAIINKMAATNNDKKYEALGKQAARRIELTDVADAPGYWDKVYFPINKRVKGFVLSPLTWYGILYNAIAKVHVTG